jgi:hypothetical protein
MDDRREEKRTAVYSHIDVINKDYDEKIGTLVDISPKGLRIKSEEQIDVNEYLNLLLRLPDKIFGKRTISLIAQCVWSQRDTDPIYWSSGFEFFEVSQDDRSAILGLILEAEKID